MIKKNTTRKIGVYGGSFDPIHLGHTNLGKDACKQLNLEKLIFVPAKYQPFKLKNDTTSGLHRLEMTKLATKIDPLFYVSSLELEKNEISYTFNLLDQLKKSYDENLEFIFLLGSDSLFSIEKWFESKRLLTENSFAVGVRPGDDIKELIEYKTYLEQTYKTKIYLLENREFDISSTDIRKKISQNESVDDYLDKNVERYIHEHRLYK